MFAESRLRKLPKLSGSNAADRSSDSCFLLSAKKEGKIIGGNTLADGDPQMRVRLAKRFRGAQSSTNSFAHLDALVFL
jgi:hypothetical protein